MAITFDVETNTNILASTVSKWKKTVQSHVALANPILTKLAMNNQISWNGGTTLRKTMQVAETDEHVQFYKWTDPLTVERKTILDAVEFKWKKFQFPVAYTGEELIKNSGGGDIQIDNIVNRLVNTAHRGVKIALTKCIYGVNTSAAYTVGSGQAMLTTDIDLTGYTLGDDADQFQSAKEALTHSTTLGTVYGGISRITTGTNPWWSSAGYGGAKTLAAQDTTAYEMSVALIRKMYVECTKYNEQPRASDYMVVMGPTNWLKLKSAVAAKVTEPKNGDMVRYGFNSFMLDGIEIVMDHRLDTTEIAAHSAETYHGGYYVYMFHVPSWELAFHPKRQLQMLPWTFQGDRSGGLDEYMTRIMAAGNFMCWQPNVNMALFQVS